MLTLLSELIRATLSGIPSSFVYERLRTTWEKISQKSWKKTYLDAFEASVHSLQDVLSKYGDGSASILIDQFEKSLGMEVLIDVSNASYSTISRGLFEKQIAKVLSTKNLLVIGGHNLSEQDYEQLIYRTIEAAKGFFRQEILNNPDIFRQAVLFELSDNRELLEQIRGYLSLHHNITLVLGAEFKTELKTQNLLLNEVANSINDIKMHLGLDKPRSELVKQIELSNANIKQRSSILTNGVCRGYILTPKPECYFLAQEFNNASRDLRNSLLQALQEFSLSPLRADDIFDNGLLLCKISGLIQSTLFGIYQLTKSQNRNVHLELGIALGLGKPFILIKDQQAAVAQTLSGLEYYSITSYLSLRYDLGEKIKPLIANLAQYQPKISPDIQPQATAIISHGDIDMLDFSLHVSKVVNECGLRPVIINNLENDLERYFDKESIPSPMVLGNTPGLKLNELVDAIYSAQLGIYRIDKKCSPDSFLALGIALGLNRPVVLVHKNKAVLPSDLMGVSALPFDSFSDLNKKTGHSLGYLLEGIINRP